ncbi:dihydrodipicolinate synthase family protein [Neomoorella mulderi]|uniref:N-acetylneuraminate lyase n=1 Tax=Moorella mulderi DSM 14980 TaxID=1122241 RepID=A0A151ATQ8_9FIRM|nr:dihydrodipicolinate synthase family protein [Moorella mulderi]KYH31038.1 N-acetylneuraminate lyase [Moorella mulderi DSM 14980]
MQKKRIEGILPALVTPFDADGEVYLEGLRRYVEHLVGKGVHGLFVCGSYGSGPLMTPEQRMQVAETVAETVNGRISIVLHIGAADTQTTLRLLKHAESLKVDAVAAVTPFYYRHLKGAIVNHYKRLIDASNLPVLVYNNPKYAHYVVTPEVLSELAEYGLAGVKDSSGDIALFYNFMGEVKKPGFIFLIGSQTHLVPAMIGGASGCVSGLSNAFPEFIIHIYELCRRGEYEEAAKLQKKANVLRKVTGEGIPVPFYHAVMRMLGVDIGVPKAPFEPVSQVEYQRIQQALVEHGMLDS